MQENSQKTDLIDITTRFFLIFLPSAVLTAIVILTIYRMEINGKKAAMNPIATGVLSDLAASIYNDMDTVTSDLMVLSDLNEIRGVLDGKGSAKGELAREFVSFEKAANLYDQIRLIDEKGIEVVRVNYNNGVPSIVPDSSLQDKSGRDYFVETVRLPKGEVYISPFELNVENGEIETPIKPVIRFGTPVFDSRGEKRGIVVINYLGSKIIGNIKRLSRNAPGKTMFLNSEGYWLFAGRPEDEWGFVFPERKDKRFGNSFPDAWKRVSGSESGQFYDSMGFFAFATMHPLSEVNGQLTGKGPALSDAAHYQWKMVVNVPPNTMYLLIYEGLSKNFLSLSIILLIMEGTGSWLLASAWAGRKQAETALRKANEELEMRVLERTEELEVTNEELQSATEELQSELAMHKQVEEEKIMLEHKLLQTQKMEAIGQLAGGIAHDFNNSLTAILGFGSLLLTKRGGDDLVKKYSEQIIFAGESSARMVNRLLTFSRKQEMNPHPVDLTNLIENLNELLKRLIGEDIELKTDLASEPLIVEVDPVQVEQVLMNLATNARDAMPHGGAITIRTKAVDMDGEIVKTHCGGSPGMHAMLSFSDTGTGMDAETKEKIFEPFFTTKEVGKGTGLGLSTVYGLVKQNNGHINVDSEPGKGTTFNILFLLSSSVVETKKIEREPLPRVGCEMILLAEDDELLRELILPLLEDSGYNVIVAVNGEDAVDRFRANGDKIGLFISDMVMPKKGGTEAYEEIKKIRPDVKVLFMSGYAADKEKWISEEGLDFIPKPFSPVKFLQKVREIIER